ncbi:cation diffusion facilitator family transporter [Limimaricola sp.]|uniref:cation diffusion facilitator family transporter n=1 Tax=Limimaricola sp. TaxID=2211665 RepID=UPI00405A347E
MAGGHSGHAMPQGSGRELAISGWLTGIYFLVEITVGLWTGSVAVISDAFHTFSAVGGVLIAIVAARLGRRDPDARRSFGWQRAELIGALANGAFLLVMAVVVIVMGAMRLADPMELETGAMLWVAFGGLVTEVISIWLLYKKQGEDLNTKGAFWHILQTFVGSLIIIVAALVIRFTGFLAIDPILGMAFGVVLLWASWGILRDAAHLLMDGTPPEISMREVAGTLEGLEGVRDAHHLHAWALTSGQFVFSGHVRVAEGVDEPRLLQTAHDRLRERFGFVMITLQVETRCLDERAQARFDIAPEEDTPAPRGHSGH